MELKTIKTDRLYVKVADQLSQLVKEGSIKPGERLPAERDLAKKLGVSRPTIREAMIALEISGLIEIRSGSGIYVTDKNPTLPLNDRGIGPFEILEIRYIVESEACALAATRITEEQIAALKTALQDMQEKEKHLDASEKADCAFHRIIAEATQNSAIFSVVNWLWELRNQSTLNMRFVEHLRKEGIHPSIVDHQQIIEALEARNPDKARIAMQVHIENATAVAETHFCTPTSEL